MNFQSANDRNNNKDEGNLSNYENSQLFSGNKYLSKRILELGTGLIPLINNSEKCCCEKTCADFCFNRLNHQECNRSICGLSDHLHEVYCNNRPFLRFNNKKTKKYVVERLRLPIKREGRKFNSDHLKDGKSPHVSTRLILSDNVSKGELIIECLGEILMDSDVRDRYQKYYKLKKQGDENVMNYDFENISPAPEKLFCLVENFIYLDMTQTGNEARHIRHSCNPNSQAEVWISRPNSHIQKVRLRNEYTISWLRMGIFALRDLEKGAEITIDYENLMSRCTPDIEKKIKNPTRYLGLFNCNCNYVNCRKIIGTRKIHDVFEFSDFLIPTANKKRRKDPNTILTTKVQLELDQFSFNKNSFESFLSLREKIIEDQKVWKEQYVRKKSNKVTQNPSNIFEIDKRQIIEIQNLIIDNNFSNYKLIYSSNNLPLWHLFSSLCWQGYHDHQECCNKHLIHNNWWGRFKEISENKNRSSQINIVKYERPRRSCSNNFSTSIQINTRYSHNQPLNQIRKKSIFLHVMSHPWLLALNNLTNIDIELGKSWKIFLARSVDLARWTIIQRLSFFFNAYNITDEDLSWPIIDQGLGDDEKCTVCFSHGTLLSCDVCSRSIHKSCLKKCNQFISSPSFCLPDWFPSNNINKEAYFKELLDYFCRSETVQDNNIPPYNNRAKKITVIYNPKNSNNTTQIGSKNEQSDQSNIFMCHKCSSSVHTHFWLRLKSREKRIISRNAMKIRFSRAYNANFFNEPNKKIIHTNSEKGLKLIKKQPNIKVSQKQNVIRSAKLIMSNLFIWRQRNNIFRSPEESSVFSELSKNFKPKKVIDKRWETSDDIHAFLQTNYSTSSEQSNTNLSPIDLNLSNKLSISIQDNCQIINSISIEDFIDSLKK